MSNSIRKRIQILSIVFISTLLITKLYLYANPQWDPFKEIGLDADCCMNCCEGNNNVTKEITNENSQNNTETGSTVVIGDGDDTSSQYNDEGIVTSPKDLPFTIVTGASKNHFCPLKSFLYSTYETTKGFNNARVIVYDLGLSKTQRDELIGLQKKGYLTELKLFNWSAYPSFWNIKNERGQYAWKPGMIHEISKEYPGIIIWLDSGTKAQKYFFENLEKFLDEFNGFISPRSSKSMKDWTHPGVYDYFNDDHTKYDNMPNCNGASVIFDTKRTQPLIDAWYKCALDKDCIAPPGSSRRNHRQDQSLLTYFAVKEGRICDQSRFYFGLNTHEDGTCRRDINQYESDHKSTL